MSDRFDRRVRVTVASRLSGVKEEEPGRFFNAFTQLTTIEDLRVSFEITKTLKKDPNTAKIVVYNLSEKNRAEFHVKPAHITLEAGYAGDLRQIYKGDITHGGSRREPPEWLTTAQCGTGANAIKHARFNRSFKKGSLLSMAKQTAKSMGLKMPTNVESAKELLTGSFTGFSLSGSSMTSLRKLMPKEFDVSIQDDQLVILKRGDTRLAEAVVISQETGMIGSPELGPPRDKGKAPILTARMLLAPDLIAGGLVQVRSRQIKGDFKVLQVKHTGDVRERPWYSDIEAIPL